MNDLEANMVDTEEADVLMPGDGGDAKLVGTKYSLVPVGTTAWLLWMTPIAKPNGKTNWFGITIHIIASLCLLPIMGRGVKQTLQSECGGKSTLMLVANGLMLLCGLVVSIMALFLCNAKTAAEHVFSWTSKFHGKRQWGHLHYWWRRRVIWFMPPGLIIGFGVACVSDPPEFNPIAWFDCGLDEHGHAGMATTSATPKSHSEITVVDICIRFLFYIPITWWTAWGVNFFSLMMYTHYEQIRELTAEVANGDVKGYELGRKYTMVAARPCCPACACAASHVPVLPSCVRAASPSMCPCCLACAPAASSMCVYELICVHVCSS